ncbi:MAG: NAD(P)H-dependent glycerol-3-phosphate dehydrogenase [Hyphomicrobiaceae bacterium]
MFRRFGVIGAGAWGSALAQTIAGAGHDVVLWAREPEVVDEINTRHTNTPFLPDIPLDHRILATNDLALVAAQEAIVMVAPAQHVRAIGGALAQYMRAGVPVIICSKGIEQATGTLMGDVLAEALPGATIAALSGPSFATEIARGLPAALTLACADEGFGRRLVESLSTRRFRLYWSQDLVGVELGGAVKNVLAIAAGIVDGKALGASAHAAVVTRGFAELRRFGEALGARTETMMGLSGLGDLLLTCGSPQSRNMSLGRALGQGAALADVLGARRSVSEGVYTAAAVVGIATAKGIEMPIAAAVHGIVCGRLTVDDAIDDLMSRPLKPEN